MDKQIAGISNRIEKAIDTFIQAIAPLPDIYAELTYVRENKDWLRATLLELLVNECVRTINEIKHKETHKKKSG